MKVEMKGEGLGTVEQRVGHCCTLQGLLYVIVVMGDSRQQPSAEHCLENSFAPLVSEEVEMERS